MTILQTKYYPYKIYITEYPGTGYDWSKFFVSHDHEGYTKYLATYGLWGDFFSAEHYLFDNKDQAIKLLKSAYHDIEEFPRSHPDQHKLKGVW
jgi:hypothetical protein